MGLSRATIDREAAAYRTACPLHPVEVEQREGLPRAFRSGQFGWRDVKWVVRWFYRRHLGTVPNDRRRRAEAAFDENAFETVRAVIADVVDATEDRRRIERFTSLDGVDVPVATGFLMYIEPDRYVSMGRREWRGLRRADEIEGVYPDPPDVEDALPWLHTVRTIADRHGCSLWDLYRTVWRLGDPDR